MEKEYGKFDGNPSDPHHYATYEIPLALQAEALSTPE